MAAAVARAQTPPPQRDRGVIVMPDSGAEAAQSAFLRGITALHNFAYRTAVADFRQARAVDPDFALAAWGEAMAHAHFVWGGEDLEAGRRVLAARRAAAHKTLPTPRERDYLAAADALFGEGDREARRAAFAERMRRLHREYPDDVEAAVFHALALLRRGPQYSEAPLERRLQAAAILEPLFKQHPRHPGVLHYLIHAYDDPANARLALPAARAYEKIAALSPHALHMPAHIFLRLGLWDEVARANIAAYAASLDKSNAADGPDRHALEWLHFARLQQGRLKDAAVLRQTMRGIAGKGDATAGRAVMRMTTRAIFAARALERAPLPDEPPFLDLYMSYANAVCAAGIGAAARGDAGAAGQAVERLAALRPTAVKANLELWAQRLDTMAKAIAAESARRQGRVQFARTLYEEAVRISDAVEGKIVDSDQSLPNPIKPVRELYGEALLDWDDGAAAQVQFEAVLRRNPRRPAALLGLARALAMRGDRQGAACRYAELAAIWHAADADMPGLAEVRGAAARAGNCPVLRME
jgi:hypothetical protein